VRVGRDAWGVFGEDSGEVAGEGLLGGGRRCVLGEGGEGPTCGVVGCLLEVAEGLVGGVRLLLVPVAGVPELDELDGEDDRGEGDGEYVLAGGGAADGQVDEVAGGCAEPAGGAVLGLGAGDGGARQGAFGLAELSA
jgi:hypothetical protein